MDFKDKIRTIQMPKVKSKTVKDKETGATLGEQHYHKNGSVGATVFAEHNMRPSEHLKPGA